jgi:hypothetical protein
VEAAYVTRFADALNIVIPIAAVVVLAFISDEGPIVTVLALLVSEFLYLHIDYPPVSRIGAIPASAIVMAMRLATAGAVLAVAAAGAALARRLRPVQITGAIIGASVAVGALQLAYFHVDYFTGYMPRLVFVSIIVISAIGASAALAAISDERHVFARLGAVALLTPACVQFAYYYVDYLKDYPTRNMVMSAGNVRMAWERVIEDDSRQTVPAVFVGPIGSYGDAGLYWRFYAIKHQRDALLTRTIENEPFEPARIRRLPTGGVVVVSPSSEVDALVRQMEAAGEIAPKDDDGLIRAPDGTPLFWVLERRAS